MKKLFSGQLLFALVLFAFLLAGCQKKGVAVVTEAAPAVTETTAAATETTPAVTEALPAVARTPIPDPLGLITMELSPNITRVNISDNRDALVRNGQVIGGIVVTALDADTVANTNALTDYLQTDIVEGIAPEEYSSMMGGTGKYCLAEYDCGTTDREFRHYIYQGNSAYYDVWFEYMLLNTWEMQIMTASVQSPDIPDSGKPAFALEQVKEIAFDSVTLPDLSGLQELWAAMQADMSAGTTVPDSACHGAVFCSKEYNYDKPYILLALSTDADTFTFQVYPECENVMTWIKARGILNKIGVEVVDGERTLSFKVSKAASLGLTLDYARAEGHACQVEIQRCMVQGGALEEPLPLYIYEVLSFDENGMGSVAILWPDNWEPLPAGEYMLQFSVRSSPGYTNDWQEFTVPFSITE